MDPQLPNQPLQQPMAPPPQPASSGIPKILLVILALFILITITAGAYVLGTKKEQATTAPTPTPLPSEVPLSGTKEGDITANWKTYKNTKYNFSFSYPPVFTVKETQKNLKTDEGIIDRFNLSFTTNTLVNGDKDWSGFSVDVHPVNPDTSINDYYKKLEKPGEASFNVKPIEKIGNAQEAAEIQTISSGWNAYKLKNKLYTIMNFQNTNVFPNGSDDINKFFSQILSTFKFTPASPAGGDQNKTIDTSNWKTYSTSKFSFQYPSNLVIKETDKDYFVFVESNQTPASNSNMAIDARLSAVYADYNQAVKSTKEGLTNVKEESIGEWLKISGLIKPPLREGTSITVALYKYGQGAIEFEISGNAPVSDSIFDQILSTFRFSQ